MRCHWIAAVVAVCLLAPAVRAQDQLIREKDGVKGTLTVSVADKDPPQADYHLEIQADAGVEVDEPKLLNDQAWKWKLDSHDATEKGGKQILRYDYHLEQTKGGVEALPDVSVSFGKGDAELKWTDILKELRELQLPSVSKPPPLKPDRSLWWIVGIAALLLGVLSVALWLMWGKKPPPPLTPAEWAMRELERIEGLGLAGPDETGWYPAEISSVIRRYLSERYGLPAQQQTTAEFLHTMRQTPELSEALQQTLKELLERCDLAKFAAMRTPPDECRRIAALARTVVQETAAPVQNRNGASDSPITTVAPRDANSR